MLDDDPPDPAVNHVAAVTVTRAYAPNVASLVVAVPASHGSAV